MSEIAEALDNLVSLARKQPENPAHWLMGMSQRLILRSIELGAETISGALDCGPVEPEEIEQHSQLSRVGYDAVALIEKVMSE